MSEGTTRQEKPSVCEEGTFKNSTGLRLDLSNRENHAEALAVASILRSNGYEKRAKQIETMVAKAQGSISVDHPGFAHLDRS